MQPAPLEALTQEATPSLPARRGSLRRCPGCPRRGGRGLAVRMKNFLQCIPPEDKVNRVPLLMHLLIHCSALQYHALHIVLGVLLCGLSLSIICAAMLCTIMLCCVLCTILVSVVAAVAMAHRELLLSATGGCALRTLRVLHSTKNCCITTSKGTRICDQQKVLVAAHRVVVFLPKSPISHSRGTPASTPPRRVPNSFSSKGTELQCFNSTAHSMPCRAYRHTEV